MEGKYSGMTISEIAKLADVSIGTVDRVLHNRGRVAPETVKRVMAIVEQFGYQPNTYARNLKLHTRFTIGVLLPYLDSEYGYWGLIYKGILKAAKELSPLAVLVEVMEFNRMQSGSFLEQGTKLLGHQIDALLIAPVMTDEARSLLSRYPDLDYAFVDSPLPDAHPVSSVLQNPYQGGFLAGRMMHLLVPGGGTFAVIQTHRNAFNSMERSRGFLDYFKDRKEYRCSELMAPLNAGTGEELKEFYRENDDVKGFFVVNDAVHHLANLISQLGKIDSTTIIGYDLIEQNRKAMLEGKVHCLISQRPEYQGYTAIYQLYRKGLLNQEPEQLLPVPIDITLPESLIDEHGNLLNPNKIFE